MSYCTPQEVELNDLRISKPKKKQDKYISYILNKNSPLLVKTDKYGFCEYNENKIVVSSQTKNNIIVPSAYTSFIKLLENYIKEYVEEYSTEFFNGKQFTREQLDKKFDSSVKTPYIYFNLTKNSVFFDNENRNSDLNCLNPGDLLVSIVHIKGIFFTKTSMGLIIDMYQGKYYSKPKIRINRMEQCIIDEKYEPSEYSDESDLEETVQEEIMEEELVQPEVAEKSVTQEVLEQIEKISIPDSLPELKDSEDSVSFEQENETTELSEEPEASMEDIEDQYFFE